MMHPDPVILAELRRFDADAYALVQLAPEQARADLAALYGFNLEIAKIREVTRDGLTGQFRLQWWRDAIEAIFAGAAPRRHPVAMALAAAVARHPLPKSAFDRWLDARGFDLEDRPPADMAALFAYAEGVGAPLFALPAAIFGEGDPPPAALAPAAARAGRARVIAGLLVAVPFFARRRRVMIPEAVALQTGLRSEALLDRLKCVDGLKDSVRHLAEAAAREGDAARAEARNLPPHLRRAFRPLVLARDHLQALAAAAYDPFDPRVKTTQRWRYAKLALASVFNRP
jgi:phytoene synthase